MNNYRRIVDEIQSVIYSADMVDGEEIGPLAEDYHEACVEVNDRLRQVTRLLEQGLRSEAIQQAEVEPNLVDVIAVLDFPELPQWHELLVALGMHRPPAISVDRAAELNEAYAEEMPLTGLLNNHRLLAIARAPMAARLRTLRQIAKVDQKNPVWRQDVAAYEKVRFKEMRRECDTYGERNDLRAVHELRKELSEAEWVVQPPKELTRAIEKQFRKLKMKQARQEMESVADRLRGSMDNLDLQLCEQLLPRWDQSLQVVNPSVGDPVVATVAPVIAWVEEERAEMARRAEQARRQREEARRQREEAARKQAIEKQLGEFRECIEASPEDVLVDEHDRIVDEGIEIPPALERRYQQRLDDEQRARRRKKLVIVFLAVTVVVAVTVAIVLYVVA